MMQSNPAVRKKKKKGGCLGPFLAVLVVFLLLAGGGGFFAWQKIQQSWEPVSVMLDAEIPVEIQPGSGVALIADELAHNNLIQSRLTFMLYCRLHHVEEKMLAGRYTLRTSQSVPEIVEILMKGQIHLDFFTIPEGYTVEQIGEKVVSTGRVTAEEWAAALESDYGREYILRDDVVRSPFEGFLFPDTYSLSDGITAGDIMTMMLNRFDEIWAKVSAEGAEGEAANYSMRQLVTIASLIERECRVDSEMSRIAGVIYNRLKRGMPLQIDATVLYALGEHKDEVLLKDLEVDSPYNTYLHETLPPGPIACPGEKALYAALHPETHEYLYYVATGDGSHEFSTNFNDHLAAQQKYQ